MQCQQMLVVNTDNGLLSFFDVTMNRMVCTYVCSLARIHNQNCAYDMYNYVKRCIFIIYMLKSLLVSTAGDWRAINKRAVILVVI